MAIETTGDQLVIPAPEDAIRIVPLHVPDDVVATAPGVAPPPAPQLTYRGGPLMTAVQVFTPFWGGETGDICAWKTKPLGPYTIQVEWSNAASTCV